MNIFILSTGLTASAASGAVSVAVLGRGPAEGTYAGAG